MLFRPDLLGEECEGIHEVLMYSIQKSDMDLRKILYQNIVLSGGSTLLKGFGDRLLLELKKNLAKDMKIRVSIRFRVLRRRPSTQTKTLTLEFDFLCRLQHLRNVSIQHGWAVQS